MEVYKKGATRFNNERSSRFADIHDMADKSGYVGKEIPFPQTELSRTGSTFEQIKERAIRASELMDKYLKYYLPNYYFTFKEADGQGNSASLIYFMEEVRSSKQPPPAEWMDSFLYQCCKMHLATKEQYGGFGVDLNKVENLKFGTTVSNPSTAKLYLVDLYPSYFNMPAQRLQMQISELMGIYGGIKSFPRILSIIDKIK